MTERETLREVGNRACRMMIAKAAKSQPSTAVDRMYYAGELGIIELYLWPDDDQMAAAKEAIEAIPRQKGT